jgi:alkylhydroperoxidase/carboxymuconolactone decarboxylase family protein YurZ
MKSPMQLLKEVAPEFAQNQMDAILFENQKYHAMPGKYKYLGEIAAAAALNSEVCTNMWVKYALNAGATKEDIVEAILAARVIKQGSVNDSISSALNSLSLEHQNT